MSWLSKKVGGWWDKASGANQKYDPNQLGREYDESMEGVNAGYDKISEYAEGMMDPYSQQNQQQRSMMNQQGADAAAQSSRMAGRNAAMAGGAPAGALAAQTASTANQSLAGSNNAFNQYLQGAQGQGASMLSGVLANQGQMQNQKFNMVNSQRQANAQADTQGAQFGANLLGQAIGMIPGLQEGGMAYDNIDHHIAYDSYQNGGVVGEDGKQHYFLGGLAASIGMGALKRGYDSLEGDSPTEKFGNIKGNLGKLGEGIQKGVSEMKQQAADTDYHRDEGAARAAAGTEYAKSDVGLQAIEDTRALGESNKEWNAANVGKKFGDEGFLSRENVGTIRVNDMMDKYAKDYDVEGGKHRVGATRAALEDFRGNEAVQAVGKGVAGTYGLAKEGVGVAKDAVVGGTGLLAGAVGAGAGVIGEGAVTAGKAIKKDWQKEKGSIGKGLLKGASNLLKEVGSPGYLRGKEMANITGSKLGLKKVETTDPTTKQPKLVSPTQQEGEQASSVEPNKTPVRVANPNEDNRVEIDGEKIVPDAILSKVKSTDDLANLDAESIKGIQESLKAAGYDMSSSEVDGGGMDGKAGPDTMKMMQEYIEKQGKQQGGFIGMQKGGDPSKYKAQLAGLSDKYEQSITDGLYTPEGDYTHKGLMAKIGYPEESRMDTMAWGGPNKGLQGIATSPSGETTGIKYGPQEDEGGYAGFNQRMERGNIRGDWQLEDMKMGRKMNYDTFEPHPESLDAYDKAQKSDANLSTEPVEPVETEYQRMIREMDERRTKAKKSGKFDKFFDELDGFQEGGTVWNPAKPPTNHTGMLSRVMGPNGEMGIKTRMGGFKIG